MDARFYEIGQAAPTLTIFRVGFFDLWKVMNAELADYYAEDAESFGTAEASWDGENEYAEVVTLGGRIVGALDRALSQDDVIAIWGFSRMGKRAFINRIRSLYNIDGDRLPELTSEQQSNFLRAPVQYFLQANEAQSDAIMREIEARQDRPESRAEAKATRKKKRKVVDASQREMLLPIAGDKSSAEPGRRLTTTVQTGRKAG